MDGFQVYLSSLLDQGTTISMGDLASTDGSLNNFTDCGSFEVSLEPAA